MTIFDTLSATSLSEVAELSARPAGLGDIAVASLGAAWVAGLATFVFSGIGLWTFLASATVTLFMYLTTIIWVAILYRLSPLHPLWAGWASASWIVQRVWQLGRTGLNALSITLQDDFQPISATAQSMDKSDAYRQGRVPHGGLFFSS
ncbi:hypothetical protein CPB85DRAFT_1437114 [Mucidula mucida]|nr:hypothetical protein CPB85DRAFT_1437114 [Mucidula mucida]